ncbi:hypothetical protein AABB24_023563 [Solanum stoloniferum]|uniref:GB1/RHD3-type G domain-containing protein n=1 Tax=Solanum stoloniferum TaxID=62892 RepID=A0ABD2SK14_9SOLN
MWCHDIGREQAANKPLLKTVFQVMMHLFSPRKTTLLFVIREKTKTPLEYLEPILREDIQKIWDAVRKPQAHKDTQLSEFFNKSLLYPVMRRRKSSLKIRLLNLGSFFSTPSLQEAWLAIGGVLFQPLVFLTVYSKYGKSSKKTSISTCLLTRSWWQLCVVKKLQMRSSVV